MQRDERHADDGDGICLNGRGEGGGGEASCTKSIHTVLDFVQVFVFWHYCHLFCAVQQTACTSCSHSGVSLLTWNVTLRHCVNGSRCFGK